MEIEKLDKMLIDYCYRDIHTNHHDETPVLFDIILAELRKMEEISIFSKCEDDIINRNKNISQKDYLFSPLTGISYSNWIGYVPNSKSKISLKYIKKALSKNKKIPKAKEQKIKKIRFPNIDSLKTMNFAKIVKDMKYELTGLKYRRDAGLYSNFHIYNRRVLSYKKQVEERVIIETINQNLGSNKPIAYIKPL